MPAASFQFERARAYPFKGTADGVGEDGTAAFHQQVEHHREQLLLDLLISQGVEEWLFDLRDEL